MVELMDMTPAERKEHYNAYQLLSDEEKRKRSDAALITIHPNWMDMTPSEQEDRANYIRKTLK